MYKDLLTFLAQNLVDNPDSVSVEQEERDGAVYLSLRVAESDMGAVIGRRGKIAHEIRTILKALGNRNGKRVLVKISE